MSINQYIIWLISTDFDQPNRLKIQQKIAFNIISNQKINHQEIQKNINISQTFIWISTGIFSMIILFLIIIIIFNYCSCKSSSIKKSLSNLSPTTTSLPCVINW